MGRTRSTRHTRDVAALISDIRKLGYEVTKGKTHWLVRNDAGKTVASLPGSPSDWRWRENVIRDLKAAGVISEDPRKVGQRPRSAATFPPPTERQAELGKRLRDFFDSVRLSQTDFAAHMMRVAQDKKMHAPSTPQSGRRAVFSITTDYRRVSDWLVDLAEATLLDIIEEMPKEVTSVATKERSHDRGAESDRNPPLAPETQAMLMQRLTELQDFLGIKIRKGRAWGHGTLKAAGGLAAIQAEQTGEHVTLPDNVIGNRFRDAVQGHGTTSATRHFTEVFLTAMEGGLHKQVRWVDSTNRRGSVHPVMAGPERFQRTTVPAVPEPPAVEEEVLPDTEAVNGALPMSMQVLAKLAYNAKDENDLAEALEIARKIASIEANR